MKTNNLFFLLPLVLVLMSCSKNEISETDVIKNYAKIVSASYADSYQSAKEMQNKIAIFLNNPSAERLDQAKKAWLSARILYGQTEVYRETNSPIDVEKSPATPWGIANEGQLNAWPIDEGYVDYIATGTAGYAGTYHSVITDSTQHITEQLLTRLNEKVTDKSISTGWHVIEFLLWGQDNTMPEENLPGTRSYTDYSTHEHASRRRQYLKVVTKLLVSDLKQLSDTWSESGVYRKVFEALPPKIALQQMINGAFFMAGDELSSERMIAPVDSTDGIAGSGQEDEHSCFSDNTHNDIYANALGINHVIFGKYKSLSGASFYDLVKQINPEEARKLKDATEDVMQKVTHIAANEHPFDYLITKEASTDSDFGPIMTAVVSLQNLSDQISIAASEIELNLR